MQTLMNQIFIIFFLPSFAMGAATEAFYISPMEFNLAPDAKITAKLTIVNKNDVETKIHVEAFGRSDDLDGSEQRKPTTDLVVDAKDFSLAKGASKIIHIAYRGPSKILRERAYRIVVRQADAVAEASLDLRFVYVASVYVAPLKASPILSVETVRRNGGAEMEILIHNNGTAHAGPAAVAAFLEKAAATGIVKSNLSKDSLKNILRQNFLAGSSRRVQVQTGTSGSSH